MWTCQNPLYALQIPVYSAAAFEIGSLQAFNQLIAIDVWVEIKDLCAYLHPQGKGFMNIIIIVINILVWTKNGWPKVGGSIKIDDHLQCFHRKRRYLDPSWTAVTKTTRFKVAHIPLKIYRPVWTRRNTTGIIRSKYWEMCSGVDECPIFVFSHQPTIGDCQILNRYFSRAGHSPSPEIFWKWWCHVMPMMDEWTTGGKGTLTGTQRSSLGDVELGEGVH